MQNPDMTATKEGSERSGTLGRLFSRDPNYLRDVMLVWPFIIFSIAALASSFSADSRPIGVRCAVLAAVAIVLAKEKLLMFFGALGFCAIQGALWLVARPWSWSMLAVTALTGLPFLLANRYWRNPKLAYQLPSEFRLVDALLSVASICGTILLFYLIRSHK